MRRRYRVLLWSVTALIGVPVLLGLALYATANSRVGRGWIERGTARLTSGHVQLSGLGGHFPERLELQRLELRDTQGLWLSVDRVQLHWSPWQLWFRHIRAQLLQADLVTMDRAPVYQHSSEPGSRFSWPRTQLDRLEIARLNLGAPLTGSPVSLQIQGSGSWASLSHVALQIVAHRLDAVPSIYRASAQFDDNRLQAQLDLQEDADGPLAHLAQLPSIGALSIHLTLAGPPEAVNATLSARAGQLTADASGNLNLTTRAASLELALDANAMAPRPGLSWQHLHLKGQWHGPISAPTATAQLDVAALVLPSLQLKTLTAQLQAQEGALNLEGSVGGLVLPGRLAALLTDSPLSVRAHMRLDDAAHPLDFNLAHRLASASGHWSGTLADGSGSLNASLLDLKPLAGLATQDLEGRGNLQAQVRSQADAWHLELSSALEFTGGRSPLATLLSPKSTVAAALTFDTSGVKLERSQLQSSHVQASAHGSFGGGALDLNWRLAMPELAALSPRLAGNASAQGQVQGQMPRLSVAADLSGQLAVNGSRSGALKLKLRARDLPERPNGELALAGTFADAPLELDARLEGSADGALRATLQRASWKSLHAQGEVNIPNGAHSPIGQLDFAMEHIADLDDLLGQPVQGSVEAHVDFDAAAPGGRARVRVDAKDLGVPAQQLQTLQLTGEIDALTTQPALALQLTTQALISGVPAHLQAQLQGPLDAVVLGIKAGSEGDPTIQSQLTSTATFESERRELRVSALTLQYRGQTAHLLSPVVLSFAQGLAVDKLRLGVGQGVLQLQGRLSPALDLSASLSDVTPTLLHPWLPGLDADGRLDGEAALQGSLSSPTGTVQLKAQGLHGRSGPARALPAAEFTVKAQLQATVAQLDVQVSAGARAQLHASGQAPLNRTAAIAMKIDGAVDLVLVNPILEASGQRVQGEIKLDADIGGTLAAPQARGNLALLHGDVQDYPRGMHLSDISATLAADGDQVRLQQLEARAGQGSISASGTLGLGEGLPLNLKLEARNAQPLSSDLVTANLNMSLTLTGKVRQQLDAAGSLHINHADLNIPNALPPSVAVLDVRRPGQQVAPERSSSLLVNLNLAVDAPRAIFVRGRGLDAEVGGALHVGGTSRDPDISGGFDLRNGTINLAGTTLTFSSGRLSFNGTGVKKKIDPTLDFTATSIAGGVTSTLNIGGYADSPVITLSSTPEMAQDEILSRLLFGVSVTQLSTLQIAQIAAALATMSGIGGNGFNPINAVQRRLRLDRLAISGNTNGAAPAPGTTGAQGTSTGATIEAGRYVSTRVFVGAKQFTTGTTQAEVQLDLTKSLKVQTTLGTGGGTVQGVTPQNDPGSSIGMSYQFEY
jgi:translocation and assembly module TamB